MGEGKKKVADLPVVVLEAVLVQRVLGSFNGGWS